MNKLLKKIMILLTAFALFCILGIFVCTLSVKESDSPFSQETQEWLAWFNSLSYEEQLSIDYIPNEIIQYLEDENEPLDELKELIELVPLE